jgi:hypothetical protein
MPKNVRHACPSHSAMRVVRTASTNVFSILAYGLRSADAGKPALIPQRLSMFIFCFILPVARRDSCGTILEQFADSALVNLVV